MLYENNYKQDENKNKKRHKTHIVEIGKQTTNKCIYIQKLHFLINNRGPQL